MSLAGWLRARAAEVLPAHAARQAVGEALRHRGFPEDLSAEQALVALRDVWPRLAQELPAEVAEAWLERAARDLHAGAVGATGRVTAPPPPSPHTAAEDVTLRFAVIRAQAAACARLERDPRAPEDARLLARHTAEVTAADAERQRAERELRRLRAEHAVAEVAAEYHLAVLRRDALRAALAHAVALDHQALIRAEVQEVEGVLQQLGALGLAPHPPARRTLPELTGERDGQAALLARQDVQRAELLLAQQPGPDARAVSAQASAAYRKVLSGLAAEQRARLEALRRHAAAHDELDGMARARAEALRAAEAAGHPPQTAQARSELAQVRAVQQVEAHRYLEGLALLPGAAPERAGPA